MKTVRYFLGAASFIFITQIASAQTNYVSHTLQAGESLSVLAKQYNTNVGDIMRMNGMHADTKLVYGSIIKIPSAKTTKKEIVAETPAPKQTTALPLNSAKHTVAKGETLFSISKKYNVSMDQLKAWNKLSNNSVQVGNTLLISNETAQKPSAQNSIIKNVSPETVADEKKQQVETTQQTTPDAALNNATENNSAGSNTSNTSTTTQQAVENNNTAAVEVNTIQQNSMNNNAVVADQQNKTAAEKDNNAASLASKNINGFFC